MSISQLCTCIENPHLHQQEKYTDQAGPDDPIDSVLSGTKSSYTLPS